MNNALTSTNDPALAGHPVLRVSKRGFFDYYGKCLELHVGYGEKPGNKDPRPGSFPPKYKFIDCSGFVYTILIYATAGQAKLAKFLDGSWNQCDWFSQNNFKITDYANASLDDEYLRIHFHKPGGRGGDKTGHVWFTYKGKTYESYGGNGPGSRPWDHQWFLDHVDLSFVVCKFSF